MYLLHSIKALYSIGNKNAFSNVNQVNTFGHLFFLMMLSEILVIILFKINISINVNQTYKAPKGSSENNNNKKTFCGEHSIYPIYLNSLGFCVEMQHMS